MNMVERQGNRLFLAKALPGIRLKHSQRHAAIDGAAVTGEECLLVRSNPGNFASDHLTGCGILLLRDIVYFQVDLGESEPGIFQFDMLVDIQIGNDIGGDAERIAVVEEIAVAIATFQPAAPRTGDCSSQMMTRRPSGSTAIRG